MLCEAGVYVSTPVNLLATSRLLFGYKCPYVPKVVCIFSCPKRSLIKSGFKVVHGEFSSAFFDMDAQKIHFLEILTYAQLLKRVGLTDIDIE